MSAHLRKISTIILIHVLKSCYQVFTVTQALKNRSPSILQLQKFRVLGKFIAFDGNLVINSSVTT